MKKRRGPSETVAALWAHLRKLSGEPNPELERIRKENDEYVKQKAKMRRLH